MFRSCSPLLSVSLLASISVVAALGACGSTEGSSASPEPTGTAAPAPNGKGDSAPGANDSGDPQSGNHHFTQWRSDVDSSMVPACSKGQAFARGLCWDEVHFKESGVVLNRPGEVWTVFAAQTPVSSFIEKVYVLKDDDSNFGAFTFKNVGVDAMHLALNDMAKAKPGEPIALGIWHYAFLPEELRTTAVDPNHTPKGAKVLEAKFPTSVALNLRSIGDEVEEIMWDYNGTIAVCGTDVPLPVHQRDVEKACGWAPVGEVTGLNIRIKGGTLNLRYGIGSEADPGDNTPQSITYTFDAPNPTPAPSVTPEAITP